MRVVRFYHGGRDSAHRERDRALARAGVDVTLVVPSVWPGPDELRDDDPLRVVEWPARRLGDVNRHTFRDMDGLAAILRPFDADVLDLQQEPFSAVVHQILRRRPDMPVVAYAAQNIDKRFPAPFAQWERRALGEIDAIYPCSNQAASVVVGKGFRGEIQVLPLAPPTQISVGQQTAPTQRVELLLVGRFQLHKGVLDAVRALHSVSRDVDATLTLVGEGPAEGAARALAAELGVADRVTILPWLSADRLAELYQRAQILLAPSSATATWVEQFGRMVVEAQAAGVVVVAYASGALPEVVGDAGILVPEHDFSALADAIRSLVKKPAEWERLRSAGLQVAQSRTWDAVARGQIDLYHRALVTRQPSRPSRPQRAAARELYGPPAAVTMGLRPFALPVLRDRPAIARPMERFADLLAHREAWATPERLRVVYLDHVARMSGGELALLRLISAMDNVDAHVILGEDGPLRFALEAAGAKVEVLGFDESTRELHRDELGGVASVAATTRYIWRLVCRLRELSPDLVHTNSLKAGYYGSVAARLAGLPVVWHLRDRIADDYLPPRVVTLTRILLATVPTLVLSNSHETRRTAGRWARTGAVVSSPVVNDPYAPKIQSIRDQAITTIGMVGRLARWKGQDVFIRALSDLRQRYPELQAHIIGSAMFGENDFERELHELVAQLGLGDAVTFKGFVTDVEAALAQVDVLVHASRSPEPFGQVVVEGMAAGIPVVATDAGGPREIITHGTNGLLVTPDDVRSLIAAVERLIEDPELRQRLSTAGRQRAGDFAPDVIAAQMQRVYGDLVTTRRRTLSPR